MTTFDIILTTAIVSVAVFFYIGFFFGGLLLVYRDNKLKNKLDK